MGRRTDYVSFFGPPRGRNRDFAGLETRFGVGLIVLPATVVAFIAVSVWWFAFRDANTDIGGVLSLEDATIPTVLLPSGAATDDPSLLLSGISIDCEEVLTDWVAFQGSMTRQGCMSAPTPTITTPRIAWRTNVGIAGWLNNPLIVNGTVYVGSAGRAQGTQDSFDGVWALDLYTGKRKWFFGATLDVNGIGFGNGIIVATGDEGRVWGINATDGKLVWEESLEVATFGSPLIIEEENLVVVGDADGRATAFNLRNGGRLWNVQVDGPIRGGAASDGEVIVFAGENREVVAVDLGGNERWRVEVIERDTEGALARIWAAPTITHGLVIVTELREDVFVDPAITALDITDGSVVWQAEDREGIKNDWGSIRSSVAVVGDLLVYGEPYSNRMVGLDVLTGETVWDVITGAHCFPHWPSPAVVSGQVILPRHDGGLYAVSVETETLAWQIYLGNSNSSGIFPPNFNDAEYCAWGPKDGHSILASPAVAPNGFIIVGTLEGDLVAVRDQSW